MNLRSSVLAASREETECFEAAFNKNAVHLAGVPLIAIDMHDLVERSFPPLEHLLTPWCTEKSLIMIHAWRGVGKTHVALGAGFAISSGGIFLGWKAPRPRKVLYVDGEMPARLLQERILEIGRSADATPQKGYFRFITPEMQDCAMPDLATEDGQYWLDQQVEADTSVIILDNLSCLVRRGGAENDAESWSLVSDWALRHRRAGRSIIFIHHSGKGGAQRGTSKREDLLDVVINLKRPSSCSQEDGATFEVHYEKARSFYGEEVAPFEARLTLDASGRQLWALRELENVTHQRIVELWELHLSITDISHEVGRHKSNVTRTLQKAQAEGHLKRPYGSRTGKGAN
jgi:hypothetical protein